MLSYILYAMIYYGINRIYFNKEWGGIIKTAFYVFEDHKNNGGDIDQMKDKLAKDHLAMTEDLNKADSILYFLFLILSGTILLPVSAIDILITMLKEGKK